MYRRKLLKTQELAVSTFGVGEDSKRIVCKESI